VIYVVRKQRIHAEYMAKREQGISAYQKGDYWAAVTPLGEYLSRDEYSKDPDAMYAFAESRRRVETRDGSHLSAAMGQYRKFLTFRPDRDDVRYQLLKIYPLLRYNTEAEELAQYLISKHKGDLVAARALVRAMQGRGEMASALAELDG